ncbi:NADAR family protein [Algoriphagus sp. NBT04N3]|jgi:ribA/ribD-fused uncharacterized protein|uniref:NADAR family protein n=1 Tax=Algoriphagus sp. NBT04N3 TaxID=2705473 RepID=UPI001C62638B|nr:NADAR family protein [Algoriphagus sp. NBT04N3]QYH40556.1 NADAR family protein [Algoriphagus sp. NBT04N3]
MKISERIYQPSEVVAFSSTKGEFGGLSNMSPGFSIRVNDVIIPTAEALYQVCRYPLFPEIQQEIIEQHSPMTAKMISRKYLAKTRQDWESIKYDVMYWVLQVKLSQNYEKFSKVLIDTGNRPIVEVSKKDKDWAAMRNQDKTLRGKNALGRLLMKLREEYVLNQNPISCVPPLTITGFLLYGSAIETVCDPALEFEDEFA